MFFPLSDPALLGADILMTSGDSNPDLHASECGGTDSGMSSVPGPDPDSQTNSSTSRTEQEKLHCESTGTETQTTTSAPNKSPNDAGVRSSDSSQSNLSTRRSEATARRQELGKEEAQRRSKSGDSALTENPTPKCNAFQEMNDALQSLLEASEFPARRVKPRMNHAPTTPKATHVRKYSKSESVSLTKMTTRPENRMFYFNHTPCHKDAKESEDGRNHKAAKKTPDTAKLKYAIGSSVSSTSTKRVNSKTPTRPAPKPETSLTSKSYSVKRPCAEALNRDTQEAKRPKHCEKTTRCDRMLDMQVPAAAATNAKDSRPLPRAHLGAQIKNLSPRLPEQNLVSAVGSDNGQKISSGGANKSAVNTGDRKGGLPLAVLTQRWKSAKRPEATSGKQSVGAASLSLTPRRAGTEETSDLPKPVSRKKEEDIEQASPIGRFRNAARKFISASITTRDQQDKTDPAVKSSCSAASLASDVRAPIKIPPAVKKVENQRSMNGQYEKVSDSHPFVKDKNLALQDNTGLPGKETQASAGCKSITSLKDAKSSPNYSKPCLTGSKRTLQSGSYPEGNVEKQPNLHTSAAVAPGDMVPVISLSWSRRENVSSGGDHGDVAGARLLVSLDQGLALFKEILTNTTSPGVDFILNQCEEPGLDTTSKSSANQDVERFTNIRFELIPNTRTQEKVEKTTTGHEGRHNANAALQSVSDPISETSSNHQTTAHQAEKRVIGQERTLLQGLETILRLPETIRGSGQVQAAAELYADSNTERLQVLSLWSTVTSGIATFIHNSLDKLTVANEDDQSGKSNQDQNISNAIDLSAHGSILNQDNFESSCLSPRDKIVRMDSFMEFLAQTSSNASSSGSVSDEDLTDKIDDYLNNETLLDSAPSDETLQSKTKSKFAGKVNRWKELLNACKQRGAVTRGDPQAQSLYNTTKLLVKRHKESGASGVKLGTSRRSRLTADDVFKTKNLRTRDGQAGPKSGRRTGNNHMNSTQPMHSIILRFSDSEDSDQGSNAGQGLSEPTGQKLDLEGETSVDSVNQSQSVDSEPYLRNDPDLTPEPSSEECPDPSLETGSDSIAAATPPVKMSSFGPVCFKQYPHLVWTLRREEAVKQPEPTRETPGASLEVIEDIELDFHPQVRQEVEALQFGPLEENNNTGLDVSDLETSYREDATIDNSVESSHGAHLNEDDSLSENPRNLNRQGQISREDVVEITSIKKKRRLSGTELSFVNQGNISSDTRSNPSQELEYACACASQASLNLGNAIASCEHKLDGLADRPMTEFVRTETGEKIMNFESGSSSEGCDIKNNIFQEPRRRLTPIELGTDDFKSISDAEYSGEDVSDFHFDSACIELVPGVGELKERDNSHLAVSKNDSDDHLAMGQTNQCELKNQELAAIGEFETNWSLAGITENTLKYEPQPREPQLVELTKMAKGSQKYWPVSKVGQTKNRSPRTTDSSENRSGEASPGNFRLEVDSAPELLIELREGAKSGNKRKKDMAEFGFTFDLSFNQVCDLPFQERANHSGVSSNQSVVHHHPARQPMSPRGGNNHAADPSTEKPPQAAKQESVFSNGTFPVANGPFLVPNESIQTANGASPASNTDTTLPTIKIQSRKKKCYRKGKCKNHNACTAGDITAPVASSSLTLESAISKCAELFCSFSRNSLPSRLLPITFQKPQLKCRRYNPGTPVDDFVQKRLRTKPKTSLCSTPVYFPASPEQTSAEATASTADNVNRPKMDSCQNPEGISPAEEEPCPEVLPSSSREFFTPSPGVARGDTSSGDSSFYSASPTPSVISPGIDNLTFTQSSETQEPTPNESKSGSQQDES